MKLFVATLFTLCLFYTSTSLPIQESETVNDKSSASPSVSVTSVPEQRQEIVQPSTPAAQNEKANLESSSKPSEPSSSSAAAPASSSEQPALDSSKESPSVSSEDQNNRVVDSSNVIDETAKSEPAKLEQVPEVSEKSDNKIEQGSVSSELPKESNNQVNAVSVDEPKPVQNEVKSEIVKDEVKSEKIEEPKTNKIESASVEQKSEEIPAITAPVEEPKKKLDSSEERIDSSEQNSKEELKKDSSTESSSVEQKKSEEIKTEPEAEKINLEKKEEKKEESQEGSEPSSPSTELPLSSSSSTLTSEKTSEKTSEPERDVIKREAAGKDKYEDKKPIDSFGKKDKAKNNSSRKESPEESKTSRSD